TKLRPDPTATRRSTRRAKRPQRRAAPRRQRRIAWHCRFACALALRSPPTTLLDRDAPSGSDGAEAVSICTGRDRPPSRSRTLIFTRMRRVAESFTVICYHLHPWANLAKKVPIARNVLMLIALSNTARAGEVLAGWLESEGRQG